MARPGDQSLPFIAFLVGLAFGSAVGTHLAFKQVEAFFGSEAMDRFKRAERDRFGNRSARPS
jgi:hypothetical protein